MKYCTSCGKQINENAAFCEHCGAAVQQFAGVQTNPAQNGVNPTPAKKNGGKAAIIAVICVAAVAVIAVAIVIAVNLFGNRFALPYGIHEDMSLDEASRLMQENGFTESHYNRTSYSSDQYFDSEYVYGYKTYFSVINDFDDGERFTIDHFFSESADYGQGFFSEQFKDIGEKLEEEYGKPDEITNKGYYWYSGDYRIALQYYGDGAYTISYDYMESGW